MKGKAPNGGECVNGEGKQGRGVRGRGQEQFVPFLFHLPLRNSAHLAKSGLLKCVMHCITLWRITFRFEGEDAFDVDLEDYH